MKAGPGDCVGLYLSVPFCRSKCSFCNFASGVFPASAMPRYVERLIEDLHASRHWADRNGARLPAKVDSIYLGGGTPSLLPPELLLELFAAVRSAFEVTEEAEITLECAPGMVEDEVLGAMLAAGVNRVSFGVQSFVDREAAAVGRLHNRETALRDIGRMLRAGISAVNVDLIAGLPHQTAESWSESLKILFETGADHASVYMLEVDEDSRLGKELLLGGGRYHAASVPGEDLVADFYELACDSLEHQGFVQYEISNFARDEGFSRHNMSSHNLKYWQRDPYLGFGVDAHSMLKTASGEVLRMSISGDLQGFLNRSAGSPGFDPEVLHLSPARQLEEAWFLGLRLNAGVRVQQLRDEFGESAIAACRQTLEQLREERLLEFSDGRARLTERGRLLSNEVFERFLVADQEAPAPELICIS